MLHWAIYWLPAPGIDQSDLMGPHLVSGPDFMQPFELAGLSPEPGPVQTRITVQIIGRPAPRSGAHFGSHSGAHSYFPCRGLSFKINRLRKVLADFHSATHISH